MSPVNKQASCTDTSTASHAPHDSSEHWTLTPAYGIIDPDSAARQWEQKLGSWNFLHLRNPTVTTSKGGTVDISGTVSGGTGMQSGSHFSISIPGHLIYQKWPDNDRPSQLLVDPYSSHGFRCIVYRGSDNGNGPTWVEIYEAPTLASERKERRDEESESFRQKVQDHQDRGLPRPEDPESFFVDRSA